MLIAGDPDCADASPAAETCRALHRELGIEHVAIPDTTHFLQIERPEACRDAMIGFLRRHGLLAGGASRPAAPAGRDPPG
jgi:pimeloyl-ACP methyl ester carboxylesterase